MLDQSGYCSNGAFKHAWNGFINSFIDTVHARAPTAAPPTQPAQSVALPSVLPAVRRLIAIGDLHGDLDKAKASFRLGGVINDKEQWVGGDTVVVQVGDLLDRGDQEVELLFWLERIAKQARRHGGAVHVINGNHEVMNVRGTFRYATLGGYYDFQRWHLAQRVAEQLKAKCGCAHDEDILQASPSIYHNSPGTTTSQLSSARWAALQPGGIVTKRFMARYPTVLQVGSTLFVHGGLLPQHAKLGLDAINRATQEWMSGEDPAKMPAFLGGRQAVVWSRTYSQEDAAQCDCDTLREALDLVPGAKRMVVGHTIQEAGINPACDEHVFRIDVGMSKGCGDSAPEVLEILDDKVVRRITEPPQRSGLAEALRQMLS